MDIQEIYDVEIGILENNSSITKESDTHAICTRSLQNIKSPIDEL